MVASLAINQVIKASEGRQPRGIVTINGLQALFIDITIVNQSYYLADTFTVTLPINKQINGLSNQYFSSEPAIMVEILLGFPKDPNSFTKNDLETIILGQVDQIEFDDLNTMITLTGRDLTAKFIDNKTTLKYPNLTSSQIIEKLGAEQGLTVVATKTTTPVGVYYSANHSSLTVEKPEWDLMTFLAQQENFALYIEGKTLYFQPVPTDKDNPYVVVWTTAPKGTSAPNFTGISLRRSRALTVARDITIKLRSWLPGTKKSFNVTAKATPNKKVVLAEAAQPIGDSQVYTYTIGGLSKQQAINRAQQILQSLSAQERNIEIDLPGDNLLKKVGVVQLMGTQTDFDQIYYTFEVERRFNLRDGYLMTVKAKNHSPNSQVTI